MIEDYQIEPIAPDFQVLVSAATNVSLPDNLKNQIEAIWKEEKSRNSHLFNGQLLSVLSYDQHILKGTFVEYKYYLAQLRQPELAKVLAITPVSVSAATYRGSDLLIGKRSGTVLQYPSLYELVPSGGVDADSMKAKDEVDFLALTLRELKEEAGIEQKFVTSIKPQALIIDRRDRNVEIFMDIQIAELPAAIAPISHEHTELKWMAKNTLLNLNPQEKKHWIPLSLYLIDWYFSR